MTQLNIFIDTIADAKSTFLKTFIQDAQFRKPLQAIVDAEATLSKEILKSLTDTASKFKGA